MNLQKKELEAIYKSLKRDLEAMEANPKDEDYDHAGMVSHLIMKFEIEGKIKA